MQKIRNGVNFLSEKKKNAGSVDEVEKEKVEIENVTNSNSVTLEGKDINVHCLTVIGQIEGHYFASDGAKATKYEQIIPLLVSVEQDAKIDGLLIILNTVGGDVEAGLALSEMIASMSKPTVSLVLGGGHSIGVPLAVSAKRSFIVPSATMTVHPVRTTGLVISAPQTYNYFNRMQDRILTFVSEHSSISAEKLRKLMLSKDEIATDMGSILEGREAVDAGLIDEVGGVAEALSALRKMSRRKRKK